MASQLSIVSWVKLSITKIQMTNILRFDVIFSTTFFRWKNQSIAGRELCNKIVQSIIFVLQSKRILHSFWLASYTKRTFTTFSLSLSLSPSICRNSIRIATQLIVKLALNDLLVSLCWQKYKQWARNGVRIFAPSASPLCNASCVYVHRKKTVKTMSIPFFGFVAHRRMSSNNKKNSS